MKSSRLHRQHWSRPGVGLTSPFPQSLMCCNVLADHAQSGEVLSAWHGFILPRELVYTSFCFYIFLVPFTFVLALILFTSSAFDSQRLHASFAFPGANSASRFPLPYATEAENDATAQGPSVAIISKQAVTCH